MSLTKLTLTAAERSSFKNADKHDKKRIWGAIRDRYGIDADMKLGVETTDDGAALYVKGSSPRQYLMADDGEWDGQTRTQVQFDSAVNGANGGRFLAHDAAPDAGDWQVISREDLLEALRSGDYQSDRARSLPDGFPSGLGANAIVLDGASGRLYFREGADF